MSHPDPSARLRERPPQLIMFGVVENHGIAVGWVAGGLAIMLLAALGVIKFWPFFLTFSYRSLGTAHRCSPNSLMRLIVRIIG